MGKRSEQIQSPKIHKHGKKKKKNPYEKEAQHHTALGNYKLKKQ